MIKLGRADGGGGDRAARTTTVILLTLFMFSCADLGVISLFLWRLHFGRDLLIVKCAALVLIGEEFW